MSQRSHKEENEFSQKVSRQGKSVFGTGPWTEPEKIEVATRAAASRPTPMPAPPSAAPTRPDKHPPCRLGDRILTGLAILSLGMLIVGGMGAYLSNDSQRVATSVRGDTATPASTVAAVSDGRYLELENRLAELNERYAQRLHTLETKLERTVDPYEERLVKLENRLESAGSPPGDTVRTSGGTTVPFDPKAYDVRLSAIEHRMENLNAPNQAAFRDLENRTGQAYARYDARLREMENRLMQIQIPYEQRIQALEQQLIYASARLDYLSSEMDTLASNNTALVQASATLQNYPPAALPPDRTASSRTPSVPSAMTEPVPMPPARSPASTANQIAAAPDNTDPTTATPESDATQQDTAGAAMAEAAANVVNTSIAADSAPNSAQDSIPHPAPETANPIVGESLPAGTMTKETAAVPEADTRQAAAPPANAQEETTRTPPKAVAAAADGVQPDNAPSDAGSGGWVINLASYARESIAAQKLADFKRKGVNAEQTVATVNGKTIYRVRIAGFETRKSAAERAETVRAQLGLKETWITRR
jgi:hypothetical protein